MDRCDICLNKQDLQEIVRIARFGHPDLADAIERTKKEFYDDFAGKLKYKIALENINEEEALEFLDELIYDETHSLTSEECLHCGHLVEIWRPIAEGPL